jgi:hypothetical protein
MKLALAQVGATQYELIEPLDGPAATAPKKLTVYPFVAPAVRPET